MKKFFAIGTVMALTMAFIGGATTANAATVDKAPTVMHTTHKTSFTIQPNSYNYPYWQFGYGPGLYALTTGSSTFLVSFDHPQSGTVTLGIHQQAANGSTSSVTGYYYITDATGSTIAGGDQAGYYPVSGANGTVDLSFSNVPAGNLNVYVENVGALDMFGNGNVYY